MLKFASNNTILPRVVPVLLGIFCSAQPAWAVSITFVQVGSSTVSPGNTVTFNVILDPQGASVSSASIGFIFDSKELSLNNNFSTKVSQTFASPVSLTSNRYRWKWICADRHNTRSYVWL
ncbi:hypothetical protein [Anthocerotibacter panamensis]|uniref:hypothetical protein n=1 Tax=Anthocerotibacter panamensis TaxID=2857077 RepID=UPI001C40828C|nr:hypothetical protein [Anthocerotibacter panamensis]